MNTDASGSVIARHDYLPFGEEMGLQYKSQVQGTIQNVSNQIVTILQFIKDNGLKP